MSVVNAAFTRTNGFGTGEPTVYPRFYMESVEDVVASQREGRPIFRDEERVEIIMAGNTHTRPVHRVADEHRQRWAEQYKAFKQGLEMAPEGTPLEEWPRLKRAQVLELKALGFITVEQVGAMDDHAMQRIPMYGRQLKNLALSFLDDAHRNAEVERITAENDAKAAEIATLRGQVTELGAMLESVHAQVRALQNAPNPLATAIPGAVDPVERGKAGQTPSAGGSSLSDLSPRRKRGAQTDLLKEPA